MAQYDYYTNGDGFLLQVQSDLLDNLDTIVVIPLVPLKGAPLETSRLHRVFQIETKDFVIATHLIGAVPKAMLKTPAGNLGNKFDEITNALDMLFHGF